MAKLSLRLHICMGESSAKGSLPLVFVVGASFFFFFFFGGGGGFRVLHLRKCDLCPLIPIYTYFLQQLIMYLSEVVSVIYTITLVCKFSYCFLYISCDSYKDDFSNKQELLEFIIISFILTGDTVRRNQMLIFLRE